MAVANFQKRWGVRRIAIENRYQSMLPPFSTLYTTCFFLISYLFFLIIFTNTFPCSPGKESTCNVGDLCLIAGLGRSPEEGMATHSSSPAWKFYLLSCLLNFKCLLSWYSPEYFFFFKIIFFSWLKYFCILDINYRHLF